MTLDRTSAGHNGQAPTLLDPSDRAFYIGLVVVVLSLVSATATYAVLTGLTPIAPKGEVVISTLFINVVLIVAMLGTIGWQATGLVKAWRDKVPGARLHVRIVVLFSVIAALPAILLAAAATTTFSRSLDGWFATKTREIINTSGEVARAYLDVHGQLINTDILNMARDIDAGLAIPATAGATRAGTDTPSAAAKEDVAGLNSLLLAQVVLRGLVVGYVIDGNGRVVGSAFDADTVSYLKPPKDALVKADQGQVPLLDSSATSRVYALTKLTAQPDRYLYVAREVSPAVVRQMRATQQNADEYYRLRQVGKNLKIAHGLMYFMISITALLAAIWAGLWFAARFVAPIRRLIEAAQEVSRGNLAIALPERRGEGDLRRLSMTFNKMTVDLKSQRDSLVAVNDQLNERRSFMEAVLSGVSAGVIGLDGDGTITLVSRSAETLLSQSSANLVGRRLADVIPEFGVLVDGDAETSHRHKSQDQITLMIGSNERTFAAQSTREQAGKAEVGTVVTFDDITELVLAQRTSAWADVARRIAHEIKNPLTPIQLSAERIKRKYGSQITTDKETFDKLADTISRQVGDIKSMVDEFAAFARMPQPQIEAGDLREVVHEPVVLFRESHPAITFELDMPSMTVPGLADRRLLTQAITNLVKNASEAIDAMTQSPDRPNDYRGRIAVILRRTADAATIDVIDNGIGLPKQNRAKLLEPYVTTRAKGTGLGLAIVQKIIEQHRGTMTLNDAPLAPDRTRGAMVSIMLPMPHLDIPAPAVAEPTPLVEAVPCATVAGAEPGKETAPLPAPQTSVASSTKAAPYKAPSVSPTLQKNSDRVMQRPPARAPRTTQGAR